MSRIDLRCKQASSDGRVLLVACMTAGDPNLTTTLVLMHSVVAQGGDVVKLLVPSPGMAPPTVAAGYDNTGQTVISESCKRALQHGTTAALVVELVAHFRKTDQGTPVILQVCDSVIEQTGPDRLARMAVAAGVDAIQLANITAGEDEGLPDTLKTAGMNTIYLPAVEPAGAVVTGTGIMALTAEHGSQIDQLLSSVCKLLSSLRPAAEMV